MSKKNTLWYELPPQRWQERNRNGDRVWSDSQRQKLYDAEDHFRNRHRTQIKQFGLIEEAQRYADKFLKSAWVRQRFGEQSEIKVEFATGSASDANQSKHRIRLTSWGLNEMTLLHELSHITQPNGVGVGHGRYFARSFLEAIGHKLGAGAKKALRRDFVNNHVKCTPKPVYSAETKAKMRAIGLARADKLGWGK